MVDRDSLAIPYSSSGKKSEDEKLLLPFTYIIQVPGKQVIIKVTQAFNIWLKIPNDKLQIIGEICQMLHNSSLLIDDIQDNSILRRGIPVAHAIYGIASTINAANYVQYISAERILNIGHSDATRVYTEQLLELYRGQGMEIYWRDNLTCPSEGEYKEMVMKKTGGLFILVIKLMQLFSENKTDFSKLAGLVALYFQVRDDYCNLCESDYTDSKTYCDDISEGKFSFPIIHAIHSNPEDKQIMHILRKTTRDIEVKKYCVSLLEKYGSFKYTRNTLRVLDQSAREEIQRLGGNPYMEKILDKLLTWKLA